MHYLEEKIKLTTEERESLRIQEGTRHEFYFYSNPFFSLFTLITEDKEGKWEVFQAQRPYTEYGILRKIREIKIDGQWRKIIDFLMTNTFGSPEWSAAERRCNAHNKGQPDQRI